MLRRILGASAMIIMLAGSAWAGGDSGDAGGYAAPKEVPVAVPMPVEEVVEAVVIDPNSPLENKLYVDLIYGRVVIELYPDTAPNHVARVKQLTREKFYDRLYFHRVIPGFMAQTGDPKNDGTGNSDYPDLKAEFSDREHVRGTLSMARSDSPDSANSQFFIVFTDEGASHLNGNYTVWGKVTEGMRFVDRIQKGDGMNGEFSDLEGRDRILRMRVAADAEAADAGPKPLTGAPGD